MLNRIDIIGRFGADPELRTTTNGFTYARFSLPLFHGFNVKERKTEWIPIEAWSQLGDIVMSKGKKGRLVHVEGELSIDNWEVAGEKKSRPFVRIRSIKFLEKSEDNASPSVATVYKPNPQVVPTQSEIQSKSQLPIEEDELEALFRDLIVNE